MTTTLAQFCDPNDEAGFGRTGVDKILLMRCARMALRARLEGVPVGLWIAPWWRALLTLRQMFGEAEVDDLCGEQLEVGVSRLMLIDFLTGSHVIGLATRDEYREARDRIPTPGPATWLGRRWERVKKTCSFFAEETAPEDPPPPTGGRKEAGNPAGARGEDLTAPRATAGSGYFADLSVGEGGSPGGARMNALPSVLILGEAGTEHFRTAEAIHENSGRRGRYVRVSCRELVTDIPAHAFLGTAAGGGRPGFLAHADGGTIYLEEIADMPVEDQRLLRAILEAGRYVPYGHTAAVVFDARLVASTSRSMAQMVLSGAFDADLFRRLSDEVVVIPPLRERGAAEIRRLALELAEWEPAALEMLPYHAWPGNVAELRDFCARSRGTIAEADVVERLGVPADPQARLWNLLKSCRGCAVEAARRLGVSRSTLYRRMVQLGIPKGAGKCG